MADNRSGGRTVHFYDALYTEDALSGLVLNPSVTQKVFHFMLDILIVASGPDPLKPGHYDVRSNSPRGTISITDEPCITRVYSSKGTFGTDEFQSQVRDRDRKAYKGVWAGFEAAHIFPLSDLQLFEDSGFSQWITNREGEHDSGINSCQNGLLMLSSMHQDFYSFWFSINPDDNYKIVSFDDDPFEVDGRILDPVCVVPNDERSVRDELLRWHFRQTVLNMRGAGEPGFELDFPHGTDMMGEIFSGQPKGWRPNFF
ncbi:hypothetical protein V1507DRAFT_485319 [Lipomyces tetrasporus]